ncbi:tol-pal system-associated acyl-CoA thioesterase [Gammaproteobacteria bacterium 53_120_T64]|nr:tol-pal system-associated acyl-CoA thioesterase [Gammaproteobacteria bacterium 53_120_T64]
MTEFRLPIRVYIEDTDAQGIVYYVNYLKFMERARSEWLRSYGFMRPAFGDAGQIFVVHSLTTNYRKPAKLDDEIIVTAKATSYGKAYFVVEQKVYRDDELLCEGSIKVACVNQASGRPTAMPKDMLDKIFSHCR